MIKDILKDSKNYLFQSPKFIKLMFFVLFGKLIYTLVLIFYNVNNLLIYRFDKGLSIFTAFEYFWEEITRNNIVRLIIVIGIIILISYAFLYPTGISASIHFLNDKKNKIGTAIGKGVTDFFVMFELNALALSFGVYTYSITVFRLLILDTLNNGLAIGLVILWGVVVLFSSIFWQYAKFIIVLENKGVFDAIKKSVSLTITNISITIKGLLTQVLLSFIFYFKTLIIVAVPLLLMYFLINSNFINQGNDWIVWTLGVFTLVLGIYILSTIQAFFKKFWFTIYQEIKNQEEKE